MSLSGTTTELELRELTSPIETSQQDDGNDIQNGEASQADVTEQELTSCDRGAAAWKLLMTAFVFEALLWGTTPRSKPRTQD